MSATGRPAKFCALHFGHVLPILLRKEQNGYVVNTWFTALVKRVREKRLNELPQFTTTTDGQNIHFLHIRSPEPDATPLVLTHGWPGSFLEFWDIDAVHVKVRDGHGANRPIYVAIAVTVDGYREILGLWAGDGGEGAGAGHRASASSRLGADSWAVASQGSCG